MTSNENSPDEELLARYRSASAAQGSSPSEAVRAAILAESRRVAAELAKTPQQPFDVSRPAANDSRWKITAFGTVGAALLAALLFAPRYWEGPPKTQLSASSASKTVSSDAAAPAPAMAPAMAPVPAPKLESIAPSSSNESLQEVVVARAGKASKPSADSLAPLAAPASKDAAADSARSDQGAAVSIAKNRTARASGMATPASLQAAAGLGDLAQTALLLDHGVAVDARDGAGRTPLMLAVAQGRIEVVRLLLQRGADPNAADNMGQTPLQQARERNLRDIALLLEGAGAH